MRSFIIRGDKKNQEDYIQRIIEDNNVHPHLVIRFEPPFSIKNANELKSMLSFSLGRGEQRVVVIPSRMSLEAQNALLKLIEELEENTFLLISDAGEGDLLPTVLSRVSEVRLVQTYVCDDDLQSRVLKLFEGLGNINMLLQTSLFLSEYKGDALGEVMVILRDIIKKDRNSHAIWVLDAILNNTDLYYKNNVNKRFFWDNVFLSSIAK